MVNNKYKVSVILSFSCQGQFQEYPVDLIVSAEDVDKVRQIVSFVRLNKIKINSIEEYNENN
jgi:hypothetical protein